MLETKPNNCELCQAAKLTQWYYEDELCWVAECEVCYVPMVVWKKHDPHPSDEVKATMHDCLIRVVAEHFEADVYIDDNMRNIPDHYHAHARQKGRWIGQPLTAKT